MESSRMVTLTQEEEKSLARVAQKHRLRFVILHGSYAKGAPRPQSDLDVAVVGEGKIPFEEFLPLYGELADVFGDSRERELDLKTLHGADPLFRYLVVRDGILLYGDPTLYAEFRAYAFRDYMDSKDLRALESHLLEKSMKSIEERYA